MAEWSIAPALNPGKPQGFVSPNLTPAASVRNKSRPVINKSRCAVNVERCPRGLRALLGKQMVATMRHERSNRSLSARNMEACQSGLLGLPRKQLAARPQRFESSRFRQTAFPLCSAAGSAPVSGTGGRLFDPGQRDQDCPRSSVNRARGYEPRGRRFDSFRGRQHDRNWSGRRSRQQ